VADRRRAGVRAARRRVLDAGVVRSLVRRLWSRTPLQPRSNAKRFAPLRATRDVTRRRRCAAPWMRRQAAVALTAVQCCTAQRRTHCCGRLLFHSAPQQRLLVSTVGVLASALLRVMPCGPPPAVMLSRHEAAAVHAACSR
jgi:hypothetical protein